MKQMIKIEGMSCNHCVNHVKKALSSIDGVQQIVVDLQEKYALIEAEVEINEDLIKQSIEDIGYNVVEIIAQ